MFIPFFRNLYSNAHDYRCLSWVINSGQWSVLTADGIHTQNHLQFLLISAAEKHAALQKFQQWKAVFQLEIRESFHPVCLSLSDTGAGK